VLWDITQSATGEEIVLSDEDVEHSSSVRLFLDLMVDGLDGRSSYPIEHMGDVIDFTRKYDCRCGYQFCLSYLHQVLERAPGSGDTSEIFILAAELNEMRLARDVVEILARNQTDDVNGQPQHIFWDVLQAARTPPVYFWHCRMSFTQ